MPLIDAKAVACDRVVFIGANEDGTVIVLEERFEFLLGIFRADVKNIGSSLVMNEADLE